MTDRIPEIEKALYAYLPSENCLEKNVIDAMAYSLRAGGKRVRPSLTLAFCALCGGSADAAMPFGCAVEMIHTYSLIHDDLPCMDNDELRRGKPSNHVVFGEDIALLAGDALQSLAFEIICCEETVKTAGSAACAKAAYTLAKYCGVSGMVGGQVIDLEHEHRQASLEVLREMDAKKTGALIKAACEMGCIAAGAPDKKIRAASLYGGYIGIAFQIVDDILDVTSSAEELGKPVGSDKENQKSTYVSLLGIEKCRETAKNYTEKAKDALRDFDGDASELCAFADQLVNRKS